MERPRTPAERIIRIDVSEEFIVAVTSAGNMWIANEAGYEWRAVPLPDMTQVTPVSTDGRH